MAVEIPEVMESFEVGDITPMKDYDMLVGVGEVVLDGEAKYQVFIMQGQSGQAAARLDNKFDLAYLEKVKEARGKEFQDDAEGVMAAMQKLSDAKPAIEKKAMEKWEEIAKDLDFEPGGAPKLEGELAEKWKEKDKAMAARDDAMGKE